MTAIKYRIRSHGIEYGDPPNIDCWRGGASTTRVTRRVLLEYWGR